MHEISVSSTEFKGIFLDIKKRYLSMTNFPKFIIGTGLSISVGVPGMKKLADKLDAAFSKEDCKYKEIWKNCKPIVRKEGLEAALLTLTDNESDFVERIRKITGEFILESYYSVKEDILKDTSGFEKLLKYLTETVSVNNRVIDIMTPNYDLVIETIADKLALTTTLGFKGNVFQTFKPELLENPSNYYTKDTILRIFKPHGSINWLNRDGTIYQINDYYYLKSHSKDIEIIAPGNLKFKYAVTHDLLRQQRESFNRNINNNSSSHSIFIYGYGFNDRQFDSVFEKTKKDVIVVTMDLKKEVINRALSNKNWTLFYKNIIGEEENTSDVSFMVYKGREFKIDSNLWNLKVFVGLFIG